MKIEQQDLGDRQVQLTVEVPAEQLDAAMQIAARRLSSKTKIAGFRPGKAPYKMVVQRYGEEAVFEEALDTLGQEVYRKALEESGLEPFAPGALNEIVSRQPLLLRYTVPLAPQVERRRRDLRQRVRVAPLPGRPLDAPAWRRRPLATE